MKFKDIEKKLQNEQSEVAVPDVYHRASKAPLNKLIDGETPARAFQKQLVTRLLIIVLALFLVSAIALSAVWLSSDDDSAAPDCYVAVNVEREGGNMRLGIIMSGGNRVLTTVVEMSGGIMSESPLISHNARIKDFIEPKTNDKVTIDVLTSNYNVRSDVLRFIGNEVELAYSDVVYTRSMSSNTQAARTSLAESINAFGGEVQGDEGLNTLILAYAEIIAKRDH